MPKAAAAKKKPTRRDRQVSQTLGIPIEVAANGPPRGTGPWRHIGGGCFVAKGKIGPCDDQYEHDKTHRTATAVTTKEGHFQMPRRARSLGDLRRLQGVKSVRLDPARKD